MLKVIEGLFLFDAEELGDLLQIEALLFQNLGEFLP
jgi:hypothetical protein